MFLLAKTLTELFIILDPTVDIPNSVRQEEVAGDTIEGTDDLIEYCPNDGEAQLADIDENFPPLLEYLNADIRQDPAQAKSQKTDHRIINSEMKN